MKTSILKRIVGLALAASMLISYVPVPVLAAETDGLCQHHPAHTAQCGYVEAAAECPCTHEHTSSCYQEVTKCVHTHDDTCGYVAPVAGQSCTCEPDENGTITHAEGCGYVEAVAGVPCGHVCSEESGCVTKVLSCQHVHDDTCGYAAAVEEQPCTFACNECAEEEAENAAVAQVEALIDALPALAEVKAMDQKGQRGAYAQLQNAYDAYDQLTEAQQAQIEDADTVFEPLLSYFNSLTSAAPVPRPTTTGTSAPELQTARRLC